MLSFAIELCCLKTCCLPVISIGDLPSNYFPPVPEASASGSVCFEEHGVTFSGTVGIIHQFSGLIEQLHCQTVDHRYFFQASLL